LSSNRTVAQLVEELLNYFSGAWEDHSDPAAPHEASKLNLAIDKAFHLLGWLPVWDFKTTVCMTASWYLGRQKGVDALNLCHSQIKDYSEAARAADLLWASA
jgi:CDP-glucose 4,6-dehydratase